MDYLLDTNIVLTYLRNGEASKLLDVKFNPLGKGNRSFISVVTVGELKSLAIRNNWGTKRLDILDKALSKFKIVDINIQSIIDKYAEIDAFSQGKLPTKKLNITARNMGKNDLWIAATASVLNISFLTSDKDFNHLDKEFLNLELFSI